MYEFSDDKLWELLLLLRKRIVQKNTPFPLTVTIPKESGIQIGFNSLPMEKSSDRGIVISDEQFKLDYKGFAGFIVDRNFCTKVVFNNFLGQHQLKLLELYLPICLLSLKAKQENRTVSVLHFAQSLDGRIATRNGNSKWIGNNENLVHAHRMRALCDAVMIGANTLRIDKPALTVRHVSGPTPYKIVIGNKQCCFDSLLENKGNVIFFTSGNTVEIKKKDVECVEFNEEDSFISPSRVLEELFKRNITSLYIEGGSITASTFLANKSVDYLQLFLAPRLFGSGILNFSLPEISNVSESLSFSESCFILMGDGVLFKGAVQY